MSDEPDTPAPITVNGEEVPHNLILEELQLLTDRYQRAGEEKSEEELFADATENAIERILLRQQSAGQNIKISRKEVDKEFHRLLRQHGGAPAFYQRYDLGPDDEPRVKDDLRVRLRTQRHLENLTEAVPRPSREEVETFYTDNQKAFVEPEAVHLSHITCRPRPDLPAAMLTVTLLNVHQQLLAGADFGPLAEQISHEQAPGGELGWITRGQLPADFETAAFALQPGEISDVFSTEIGVHIVRLNERRDTRQRSLESVYKAIETDLWDRARNRAIGEHVDALLQTAEIVRPEPTTEPETADATDDDDSEAS